MKRRSLFAAACGFLGIARAQRLADPQNQWNNIWWRRGGKALNNQCPTCGEMAEPYDRRKLMEPPENVRTADGSCFTGSMATGIRYVPCSIDDLPKSQMVRCQRCNGAFYQDAEK